MPRAKESSAVGWSPSPGTLAAPATVTGRGLHTNNRVTVRLFPRESGGIVFRRLRRKRPAAEFPLDWRRRVAQPLCTMLRYDDGVDLRSTEHLLASLVMAEIDHVTVELDAEELPGLDGSALGWLSAFAQAGRRALPGGKRFLKALKPVRGEVGNRHIDITPADGYLVSARNELRHFGKLRWHGTVTPASFAEEIALSRSYGHLKWALPAIGWGYLSRQSILRGAGIGSTAIILWGNRVLGGVRRENEFPRHRVLDLLGDFALIGAPLLADVDAHSPSHETNYRALTRLMETPGACEWVEPRFTIHNSQFTI